MAVTEPKQFQHLNHFPFLSESREFSYFLLLSLKNNEVSASVEDMQVAFYERCLVQFTGICN